MAHESATAPPLLLAAHERRRPVHSPELKFKVADSLPQVIEGWQLTHDAYVQTGLIDANPFRLHTTRHALHPDSTVLVGRFAGRAVSTLTVMPDRDHGLPLDRVYPGQLDRLRRRGRQLVEVGMLADRREHVLNSMPTVLEMMRYAYFSAYHFATDIVIGVHPHHVAFYQRFLAFDVLGQETTHPGVKNHPVVLLRLALREKARRQQLPKGTALFHRNPLGPEVFEQRYRFLPGQVAQSVLAEYLRYKGQWREEVARTADYRLQAV